MVLEDKTTVWMARDVLAQFRGKKYDYGIDTGSGLDIYFPVKEGREYKYKVMLDGTETELPIMHLGHQGKHFLKIHNNLEAPIIFRMDIGWSIWLKSIESPQMTPIKNEDAKKEDAPEK